MPRGLPDYYNPDTLVSQRLANVEELLTQLRGVASSDNRGRTWVYDNFSEGFGYLNLTEGGDAVAPVLSTDDVEVSPCSIKLGCGTLTGSGKQTGQKILVVSAPIRAGFEIGYTYWVSGARPMLALEYEDATTTYIARMRVEPDTGDITIWYGGGWLVVGAIAHTSVAREWLSIKLVVDFINGVYLRAIIGQTQISLDDYALPTAAGSNDGQLSVNFEMRPVDDGINLVYLGHLAITVDEP